MAHTSCNYSLLKKIIIIIIIIIAPVRSGRKSRPPPLRHMQGDDGQNLQTANTQMGTEKLS